MKFTEIRKNRKLQQASTNPCFFFSLATLFVIARFTMFYGKLGGDFKDFLFSPLLGEDFQFD